MKAFELIIARGETVAFAESLTGGLIAAAFIENPGASAAIHESYVTYAEASKQRLLGVKKETLESDGVVSAACACQMAAGARARSGADWAVSATGLAGPDGGTAEKPVGTVFIGIAGKSGAFAREFHFSGDRAAVRRQAVEAALSTLAEAIEHENPA